MIAVTATKNNTVVYIRAFYYFSAIIAFQHAVYPTYLFLVHGFSCSNKVLSDVWLGIDYYLLLVFVGVEHWAQELCHLSYFCCSVFIGDVLYIMINSVRIEEKNTSSNAEKLTFLSNISYNSESRFW